MAQSRQLTSGPRMARRGGASLAALAMFVLAGPAQAQGEIVTVAAAAAGTASGAPAAPAAAAAPAPAAAAVDTAAILASMPKVTAEALLVRLAKPDPSLLLLDVRSPEEYAAGHVPGARNLPQDQLAARLGELQVAKDAGQDVVLYCRSGRRAALALQTLRGAGFSKIAHLEGDFQGWEAAGRDVARAGTVSSPPVTPAAAPAPAKPR